MDDSRGLKILSDVLGWDEDQSRTEFAWLKMMAAIKYDDYRDFLPGMRFLENLAAWLQQFEALEDRLEAYALLRHRLIYVSPPEMQRLVELCYHSVIESRLVKIVAARRQIPPYQVHVDKQARAAFERLRRRTLILGLSDGARLDILRHSTAGTLTNEQFAIQTQLDSGKWASLLKDLRDAQSDDKDAAFEVVFLVDDFMGTGTSFLRLDSEGKWTGKLSKFLQSIASARDQDVTVLAPEYELCVHHYLATERAAAETPEREKAAIASGQLALPRASNYTFGAVLLEDEIVRESRAEDRGLVDLTNRYYSTKIQTKHTEVGGASHIGLGYGRCGLPLVLHHNTPNNSLALIWAEANAGPDKNGVQQPEMRPLFRRRQRHSEVE
jgi:hypothetical protein